MASDGIHADVFGEGPRAVLVHGSFGWGLDTFPAQRELSDAYELVLLDRRGYGASPDVADPGWRHDAHDLLDFMEGGAHLVGQSYGAVVCLLAAGLRPEAVRSLVVIEPVATSIVPSDEAAERFATAMRECHELGREMTPAEFFASWYRSVGREPPDTSGLSAADWRAVEATRRESPAVDAPIDVATLAGASWPKLVVQGCWPDSSGTDLLRDACASVCKSLHVQIGGRIVEFERSAHNPQLEEPDRFNAMLRELWSWTAD